MQESVTQDRDKFIGGSDVSAIMNLSTFKTRWQLLQEKAGIIENDFSGNEYTVYGNVMEDKIRSYINEKYHKKFREHKVIQGDVRCHTDGYDTATSMILEIKTTSQVHDDVDAYKNYLVQLLFYMLTYKTDRGMLAVYARPEDFDEEFDPSRLQVFGVNMSDYKEFAEEIMFQVDRFRADLAKLRENPFLTEEDLQPFDLQVLSNSVVELEQRLAVYKEIEKQCKEEKEQLKKAMQEYGIKKWTTNNGVKITLVDDGKDTTVRAFDESLFREENPELYEKYLFDKVKKGRAGYVRISL